MAEAAELTLKLLKLGLDQEAYRSDGCKGTMVRPVPMFAALRKSASGPLLKYLKPLCISDSWGGPEGPGGSSIRRELTHKRHRPN